MALKEVSPAPPRVPRRECPSLHTASHTTIPHAKGRCLAALPKVRHLAINHTTKTPTECTVHLLALPDINPITKTRMECPVVRLSIRTPPAKGRCPVLLQVLRQATIILTIKTPCQCPEPQEGSLALKQDITPATANPAPLPLGLLGGEVVLLPDLPQVGIVLTDIVMVGLLAVDLLDGEGHLEHLKGSLMLIVSNSLVVRLGSLRVERLDSLVPQLLDMERRLLILGLGGKIEWN